MTEEPPPFDALVAAYEPGPGPGGLRALVPLAGRPLVEHQLRRSAVAGARALLLLVDEVPPELAEVVTVLRREGLDVRPVRGLDIAADAVSPDRPILLIADACLPEEAVLRRLAAAVPPCVATLPDTRTTQRYERIDAGERWAGSMLLDGARLGEAAAMLGSWDAVSTLLRRAVQEGARRLDVSDAPSTLLLDGSEVSEAEARIVVAARPEPANWAERWIQAPLLALALPFLLERRIRPAALAGPGAALALGGGALGLVRLPAAGLLLLLLAGPMIEAGRQLARIADHPLRLAQAARLCLVCGAAAALGGLGVMLLHQDRQWGWLLLVALIAGGLGAVRAIHPLLRCALPIWLAWIEPLLLLLVPFAILRRWDLGVAACAAYVTVTAGWHLRALIRQAAADARLAMPNLI